MIHIEVVYAGAEEQCLVSLSLPATACIQDAIYASGLLMNFPEIDLKQAKVGIHSKLKSLEHPLQEGDRVEIYRPLTINPKDARRKRAK